MQTAEDRGSPTTSYKANKADDSLPPVPPDEPPSTPTPSSPNGARRRRSPNPTVTSLLPDEENNEDTDYHNGGSPSANNTDRCGDFEDQGQRATVSGMILRKSKAFMFGQVLSLFLVSSKVVNLFYSDCSFVLR